MIIFSPVGMIKGILLFITSYLPEPFICSKNKINVELDLFNQATESNLKNAINIDTSQFAKKVELANLKSDIDKLEKVPSGLNCFKRKVDDLDVDNCSC